MKTRINSPWRIASMFFALTLAIAAPDETQAAATRPLRIAYLFTSGTMASMWMAKETGGFAKEGLDVEMIPMSSTLALPALLANEVDVIQGTVRDRLLFLVAHIRRHSAQVTMRAMTGLN